VLPLQQLQQGLLAQVSSPHAAALATKKKTHMAARAPSARAAEEPSVHASTEYTGTPDARETPKLMNRYTTPETKAIMICRSGSRLLPSAMSAHRQVNDITRE